MSLTENLQNAALYDHPVDRFEMIETHISWVILTGDYVYKIKKPVNFGFLDFSTLEKRGHYCEEEVRLNRRLAPQLYLGVVAITGSEAKPVIDGEGPVIEYAVKMRQFPQSTQLDRLLASGQLLAETMDALAEKVAQFHLTINKVDQQSEFGDLEHIRQPVLENFSHIRNCINDDRIQSPLNFLEVWTKQRLAELADDIQQRKKQGFVRECHGDMHLRNIALWNDEIIIFDCIEFNKNFYWIDVISEIAFLVMDLEDRHQQAFARRFLNRYLEITGDYEGLKLLTFYKVYRAMVRAKVDALRVGQEQAGTQEYNQTFAEFGEYLDLAESYTRPGQPVLLVNYGFSGSGKSVGTRLLLEKFPAIQVRSDVERKRLFNIDVTSHRETGIQQSIYSKEATKQTYSRLKDIAEQLLRSGFSVVIDAANLKCQQRKMFIELADKLNLPCYLLAYEAPEEILRQRIGKRIQAGTDVSDANLDVLQYQLESYEPITDGEQPFTIRIDTVGEIDINRVITQINAHTSSR